MKSLYDQMTLEERKKLPLSIRFFCTKQGVSRVTLQEAETFTYSIEGAFSEAIESWLLSYIKGIPLRAPPLALEPLSLFEERVRDALLKMSVGEKMTYGELAEKVGYPGAHRAVGNALSKNPLPLIIPCHRIVAKGRGGGFAFGSKVKELLLCFEEI